MRLATKYVLLGLSDIIRLEHPSAGLAFLGYCESISEETQNQHHQNTNYQFFSGSQLSGPDGNDVPLITRLTALLKTGVDKSII